ncbi:polyketide synthase [Arthroderma uncinatum]|uniref:polyketide synthase n=1 Tax=Arthroderma uncinatum TaxID=74035 RepID=UPI00144A8CA2|nr:polyketide synthase [Arthroderma uncinatum]KAF3480536.1 polyketide synthase [Arthroderma uncinatum]
MENTRKSLLIFGSQIAYSEKAVNDIKTTLQNKLSRQWVLDTLAGLPKYWDALAEELPKITDAIGSHRRQLLEDLGPWLESTGNKTLGVQGNALPGVAFVPLIVLQQLTEYRRYLQASNEGGNSDPQVALTANKPPAVGFCVGLLGDYAVASAHNIEELDKYGAVAVRLAMLAGALSDAQDTWNPHRTYVVAWTNVKQQQDLHRIVDSISPDAYISLLFDEARATVTVSERAAARFTRKARTAGVVLSDTSFRGELHSPKVQSKKQIQDLVAFCNNRHDLQFAEADHLALTTFTNAGDGKPIASGGGSLHAHALETLFVRQCDWYGTFAALKARYLNDGESSVITFGPGRCLPPTLVRNMGSRPVHFADVHEQPSSQEDHSSVKFNDDDDAIVIVGMSIKVSGADDLEEFSQLLHKGTTQHEKVTRERLNFDSLFREPDTRDYFCNFVRDVDAFDNRFFKRSPRESAAMDPQHRLLLQAAYHAVEQAGLFTETTRAGQKDKDRNHVGVYIGSPSVDYEHNVATHPLNALMATGNLQSYLPGRVANHFGWTGPAIAFDTACSSSAVAIHTACSSLRNGECYAALAGGVCILTNPHWFQNLTAASFLSPTGQCKPFDEKGDGYCRAEGIACVFLKRMGDARADGNPILGRLLSSAVYQNQNHTPIFVPNSPSLAHLFGDVVNKAGVSPSDIALVEAHGTGTAVGDPAEWAALRKAVGGPIRPRPLPVGSVKGHIGHTEGTSGVISLIKVLMMIHEGYIPPQASFNKLNATIKAAADSDMMEIVTSLRSWDSRNKVVLINNYGASGSNAAMVVAAPPTSTSESRDVASSIMRQLDGRLPFFISGFDGRAVKEYAVKLAGLIKHQSKSTLADLSFNINRQSNPDLPQRFLVRCRSVSELQEALSSVSEHNMMNTQAERPVVLCFGGQVSTFVGLDRKLYDGITVFRHHLDECDNIVQDELSLPSIFPDIFSRTPLPDPVRLQVTLFAMQYASARSWIDCGLSGKIVSVVGHSFGELTALCISGVLSLKHALTLVALRAQLVHDAWGGDKGSMMAVEADESLVRSLLEYAGRQLDNPPSIACYNGPRSFTLSGTVTAIDTLAEVIASNSHQFSAIKSKRLNVTNAFHSSLVDPLLDRLEQVGNDLEFHEPLIHMERATETAFAGPITAKFVPDHMRYPVFFSHAIQRIAKKHPSAIFLEAGSSSTIAIMASRALAEQASKSHHFESVSVTNEKGLDGLTDATVSLWRQGLRVAFWAHHSLQTNDYTHILLPPYQFEKARHWMEFKSATDLVAGLTQDAPVSDPKSMPLWEFVGYQGNGTTHPRFRVNLVSEKFKKLVSGHVFAHTAPVLSGTVQSDMAVEAIFSIHPDWKKQGMIPTMIEANIPTPICVDSSRKVWINYEALDAEQTLWQLNISSTSAEGTLPRRHLHGRLHIRSPSDPAFIAQFARFERLVPYEQCAKLLAEAGGPGVDVLQGRQVYRAFSEFIEYSDQYNAMYAVVGKKTECAGRVHRRHAGESFLDIALHDSFKQVSGLFLNCMSDAQPGEIHIGSDVELVMRSPRGILQPGQTQDVWHAYARHSQISAKVYMADAFVFNAANGELVEVILGLQYTRMSIESMKRLLMNLTKDEWALKMNTTGATVASPTPRVPQPIVGNNNSKKPQENQAEAEKKSSQSPKSNLTLEVKRVLASVVGAEVDSITIDTIAADIGIDSLMGIELLREINSAFHCQLDLPELLAATTVGNIVTLVASALSQGTVEITGYDDEDNVTESSHDDSRFTMSTSSTSEIDTATLGVDSYPIKDIHSEEHARRDVTAREAEAERYVVKYTAGWIPAQPLYTSEAIANSHDATIIVTGATGSLGAHVVAALASHQSVKTVVCINRHRPTPVETRQDVALSTRGITLTQEARSKLRILETDTSQPQLGLKTSEYQWLTQHGSHIVHSAWPLSGSRPMSAFASQFQTLRNLLDLARDMAVHRRVGFQLISSLSVVGRSKEPLVPERRVSMDSVLPPGYGEAKWVCERMLEETVHKHPTLFRAMAVRPAQIAGSSTSGVWNSVEQIPFIVKSAQSLGAWPNFLGAVRWIPVDAVAAVLVDLLYIGEDKTAPDPWPIYHIDDPVGRPWKEISSILADALDIPSSQFMPFKEWLSTVASSSKSETENPAKRLVDFLGQNFEQLSCGGLVLDTTKAQKHSATMRALAPVSVEVASRYIKAWKETGFLAS